MRAGPRIQAAAELFAAVSAGSDAADGTVATFFRQRRYAGSKDRAAITELFYALVRRRAWLEWRVANTGGGPGADARTLIVAQLADAGVPDEELAALFDGSPHAPAPLTLDELALVQMLRRPPSGTPPPSVAGNYPGWLHRTLERRFGPRLASEMAALNDRAPVDLRVNTLKADRASVLAQLNDDGIEAAPTVFSRVGVRLTGNPRFDRHALYLDGAVEVQDEGSQIVAALASARAGETVVDYCAGAGGKSLAMAAAMEDRGIVFACDTDRRRLKRLEPRLSRAGAGIVRSVPLADDTEAWQETAADAVLLDVPCSGTGAWRRRPEARWSLSQEDIINYSTLQYNLLAKGKKLVGPNGRLIYATCSVLREEGEDRVAAFLAANPDFSVVDVATIWPDVLDDTCPGRGPFLELSPGHDSTDGFFTAVLRRDGP